MREPGNFCGGIAIFKGSIEPDDSSQLVEAANSCLIVPREPELRLPIPPEGKFTQFVNALRYAAKLKKTGPIYERIILPRSGSTLKPVPRRRYIRIDNVATGVLPG